MTPSSESGSGRQKSVSGSNVVPVDYSSSLGSTPNTREDSDEIPTPATNGDASFRPALHVRSGEPHENLTTWRGNPGEGCATPSLENKPLSNATGTHGSLPENLDSLGEQLKRSEGRLGIIENSSNGNHYQKGPSPSTISMGSREHRSFIADRAPVRRIHSAATFGSKRDPFNGSNQQEQGGPQVAVNSVQNEIPIAPPSVIITQSSVHPSAEVPTSLSMKGYLATNTLPIQKADTSSGIVGHIQNDMITGTSISVPSLQQAPVHPKPRPTTALRRGKWTVEEEAYVARVIQDFNSGYLNAPAGTTLRSYLSEKLHCDPMRITKKFTGDACIGKRVFHPAVRCPSNTAAIDKAQAELDALERRWRRRLEMQQRESAKKAAASAAAAAAAASGRNHLNNAPSHLQASSIHLISSSQQPGVPTTPQTKQHVVTQAASWLDRANAVLSGQNSHDKSAVNRATSAAEGHDHAEAVRSLPPREVENQMKEVQRLIHEGPIIQKNAAGLPHLLDQSRQQELRQQRQSRADPTEQDFLQIHRPRDKRPRRLSGAEDAEALVGFLNSVRAAAASGDSSAT